MAGGANTNRLAHHLKAGDQSKHQGGTLGRMRTGK